MKRLVLSKGSLARFTASGIVVGSIVGLAELLLLVYVDLVPLTPSDLLSIGGTCGVLGLLGGLGLGLLRGLRRAPGDRDISPPPDAPTRPQHGPGVGAIACIRQDLAQGIGAGLTAGGVIGLVEIAGLMVLHLSRWPALPGLLYAVVVYGMLGLLVGLVLGLWRGLWRSRRACQDLGSLPDRTTWPSFTVLLVSLGTFLVVHYRIRSDVIRIQPNSVNLTEILVLDNALLVAVIALGGGLWVLLRRLAGYARLRQCRWNVGLYVALVLLAALVSETAKLAAPPDPTMTANVVMSPTSFVPGLRDRPNVLFIMADTLRADRLGCYVQLAMDTGAPDGLDADLTPNLDGLARDAVLYRQMSAQASWTKPSVATMLTSLYPTSHRAITITSSLPDGVVSLPEILSAAGYRTAGFTANPQAGPRFNFQQGYDEYTFLAPNPPAFAFGVSVARRFAVFAFFLHLRNDLQSHAARPHDEVYQDAATVNQHALAWLEANKDSQFFLYLHYMDPHPSYFAHPYDGTSVSQLVTLDPDPAQAPYIRRLYDGEVSYLDTHLGILFDALREWGLYEDLLIVFTSDHGEEFYEHDGWWHSNTLYEEMLAVPLLVKYPGRVHAGMVDDECARGLDLAPTILDVVGLAIPEAMQGTSLQPGAVGPRAEFTIAELLNGSSILSSIRIQHRKFIVASEDNQRDLPTESLFDLRTDPGEQRNLAQGEPDAVRNLRAALDQVIAYAQAYAVTDQTGELDAATRERLKQLGY